MAYRGVDHFNQLKAECGPWRKDDFVPEAKFEVISLIFHSFMPFKINLRINSICSGEHKDLDYTVCIFFSTVNAVF